MQRRSFLKLAATAPAFAAFPQIVRAETLGLNGKVSPSNKITIASIGIGSQGGGHLKALLNAPDFRVAGLCDVDRKHLDTALKLTANNKNYGKNHGALATDDFREILADPKIDALLCALPDHWHALPVILGAQAGKDIYTEKPFGFSIPEGRAMVNAVVRSGCVCQTGSQQRSGRSFRRAVELVRAGVIGKIKQIRVTLPARMGPPMDAFAEQPVPSSLNYDLWLGPAPLAPYNEKRVHHYFRYNYDYSGGSLNDWIGHHYDIAAWGAGLSNTGPVAIQNARAEFIQHPLYNTPKKYYFEARYANGVVISVTAVDEDSKSTDFIATGDGGTSFEGEEGWIQVSRRGILYSSPRFATLPLPSDGFRLTDALSGHRENWAACIRDRRAPVAPAWETHRTSSVAALANIAFRTGRSELKWNPDTEQIVDAPDAAALLQRPYRAPWQLA
ncbi:MAG: Gfo/Idh/MocA family oxidoreductase [Opitutaceae bacterium]|jgi:predicted dehydrogenase|nr:Gfo/Idh/MocA family oxidoreductase [Opitutaceae bacterium]